MCVILFHLHVILMKHIPTEIGTVWVLRWNELVPQGCSNGMNWYRRGVSMEYIATVGVFRWNTLVQDRCSHRMMSLRTLLLSLQKKFVSSKTKWHKTRKRDFYIPVVKNVFKYRLYLYKFNMEHWVYRKINLCLIINLLF